MDSQAISIVNFMNKKRRGFMMSRSQAADHFFMFTGIMLLAMSLSGCASIRGGPGRITADDAVKYAPVCPSDDDLKSRPATESEAAYRDRIIHKCISIIDGKYDDYVQGLSVDRTTTDLVTEVGAQALTGVASVAKGARVAAKLSAGSAFLLGVNGVVNKDLFYKQTLPAIIASMDTQRTRVLTVIIESQVKDPDAKIYTLAHAGADISRYQRAGNMLAAIRELTTSANDSAQTAADQLKAAQINLDNGTANLATPPTIKARVNAAVSSIRSLANEQGSEPKLQAIAASIKSSVFPEIAIPAGNPTASTLSQILRVTIMRVVSSDSSKQADMMDKIEAAISANTGA